MHTKVGSNKYPSSLVLTLVAGYVALVLVVDTLAALGVRVLVDWRTFQWVSENQFDWFKVFSWCVVPFVACLRRMDWGYMGFHRWKRRDWFLLFGIAVLVALAMTALPHIPGLRDYYPSLSHLPWPEKREIVSRWMLWVISWVIGWEFLHRYFLLRPFAARWPRFGWIVVPISEGLYHLQKHPAEMAGMVVVSIVLTLWTLRRRNVMLPLLAHLIVEVELILFLVLV